MELEEFESLLIDNENENLEKNKRVIKKEDCFLVCLSLFVLFIFFSHLFSNSNLFPKPLEPKNIENEKKNLIFLVHQWKKLIEKYQ